MTAATRQIRMVFLHLADSNIAISVRNLSKSYTISHDDEKRATLTETLINRVKTPLKKTRKETFWALQNVSFDIKKGEVVGIIGRNGAGKSTILKVLSRITQPTTGSIELWGKVGSLLEVGTGFHPELTGRENVYLNGAILGMAKRDISKQFDAIVDFAGVEKFLDTPVKRYSSGMYMRLAFAVAAHLNSDILIVDEVLAVGDAEFQKKCLGKMKEVSSQGSKTVLFVSHNIVAISSLCDSCVLLSSGKVVLAADTRTVISRYLNESNVAGKAIFDISNSTSALAIASCATINQTGELAGTVAVNERFTAQIELYCRQEIEGVEVSMRVDNASGQAIFTTNLSDLQPLPKFTVGYHTYQLHIPGNFLAPDRYSVTVGVHRPNVEVYDIQPNALCFDVDEIGSQMSRYRGTNFGVVLVQIPWTRAQRGMAIS
jgi:lipopolysaccharide transport system ATP-binding protein